MDPISAQEPKEGPEDPGRRIFVNRDLRLDKIKAIGFDMDYTLARYHHERLEGLAHQLTLEGLVARGYPAKILDFRFDPDFIVRGLTVDKERGTLLKIDRHHHVGRAFLGRVPMKKEERRKLYRNLRDRFTPPRFSLVDTLFALPEICIFADLIDLMEKEGTPYSAAKIFDDTRACIDAVHANGSLKSKVKEDVAYFVDRDPWLAETLRTFRISGKQLFLLTNSYFPFSNAVMTHLLGEEWQTYFDWLVVGSQKPGFFDGEKPFFRIDSLGEAILEPVTSLKMGEIYQGGNLVDFEAALNLEGDEILYVGDHIYGDILRSKRKASWRTALVVEELEHELACSEKGRDLYIQVLALERRRRHLDNRHSTERYLLNSARMQDVKPKQIKELETRLDATREGIEKLVERIRILQESLEKSFNPYWGMIFKEGQEITRFADQVQSYACVYTSRVSNFLAYSPFQYLRTPRTLLPHELAVLLHENDGSGGDLGRL